MSMRLEEDAPLPLRNPLSAPQLARTWKPTYGILFHDPKRENWNSSRNVQNTSFESSLSPLPAQRSVVQARQLSNKCQAYSLATQDAASKSEPKADLTFPQASSSEPHTQNEQVCPQLHIPLVAQEMENADANGSGLLLEDDQYPDTQPCPDEPFCTPLGFHIPKAKLYNAMDYEPPHPAAYWQYRLYQGPGGENDKVKVHYCKNKDDTESIAQFFLEEQVIGFDIEWKVNAVAADGIRKNVALVQVASERRVALFHIARYPNASVMDDFVAPSFKKIMESPEITKVGVAIKGDCTRLRNHLGIDSHGLLELSHLHKLVKYACGDVTKINKMLVSLADQAQEHLGLPLWKGEVRSSDWSQDLHHQQTQYAASDSYAAFQLFHVLEAKRKALNPTPPRPAHAELNLPIRLADGYPVSRLDEEVEITRNLTENPSLYPSISVEELVHEVNRIAIEDSSSNSSLRTISHMNARPLAPSSKENSTSLPPSPELSLANDWVDQYRISITARTTTGHEASARPAELRAYALWHEQGHDIPKVASILREPPLQNTTVTNYIGRAIQSDGLPYDSGRIRELEQYSSAGSGIPGVNWKRLRQGGLRVGEGETPRWEK